MSFIPLHDISKLVEYKTPVGSRASVAGVVDSVDVIHSLVVQAHNQVKANLM